MELTIYDITGKDTGKKAKLDDAIFGIEPNDHAIYLDVKQYLANQRQGTHKSKERNEIAGSTRKLKKQKGTGGARSGSILSPLFPGGGRVFGPQPRDYSFKLNKKLKQLARKSALTYKAKEKQITVIDAIDIEPRTKEFVAAVKALGLEKSRRMIVVLGESTPAVVLAARNIPGVKVMQASDLNTYDVMNSGRLLMTAGAIDVVNAQYSATK